MLAVSPLTQSGALPSAKFGRRSATNSVSGLGLDVSSRQRERPSSGARLGINGFQATLQYDTALSSPCYEALTRGTVRDLPPFVVLRHHHFDLPPGAIAVHVVTPLGRRRAVQSTTPSLQPRLSTTVARQEAVPACDGKGSLPP